MNELRLCLIGQLRSGKDTLAAYAEEKYGMVPFAFGDELKEEFHRNYPFVPKDPKPRKGYQLFGQLKRYVYGEDIWVDKCFSNIRTHKALSEQYREYHPTIPLLYLSLQTLDSQMNLLGAKKRALSLLKWLVGLILDYSGL
jgi:hypothetical protein